MRRPRHPETVVPVEAPEPKGLSYALIGDEGKIAILNERARNLEAEHFNHATNAKLAESVGNDEGVRQAKAAQVIIEGALALIQAEIKAYGG